jgi:hypothetical protein
MAAETKTATLDVGGFKIDAIVAIDSRGDEFLTLVGVDCDLDGPKPAKYWPEARS